MVGVPQAFSVYTLWPLYSWFFHDPGHRGACSPRRSPTTAWPAREGSYCFPAEIAHGAVQDILDSGLDYIFVPHFRDMESYEDDVHANFCPITQALPYYIKKAFPEIAEEKFLAPIVSFKFGKEKALEEFIEHGAAARRSASGRSRQAFDVACDKQDDFWTRVPRDGRARPCTRRAEAGTAGHRHPGQALQRLHRATRTWASRASSPPAATRSSPSTCSPSRTRRIFTNMYWYYGQQDMKASVLLKDEPNIFITYHHATSPARPTRSCSIT